MKAELIEKIIAYNKAAEERREKATDLDTLVSALLNLPPGQLKNILTDDVLAVLRKYGYEKKG